MKKASINIGFLIYKFKWYFICFSSLFLIGILTNKILETGILVLGFITLRYIFPSTLHLDKVSECIVTSILLLGVGIIICFSKNLSIYSSIMFSFALCMILYIVDYACSILKRESMPHNRDRIRDILGNDLSKEHILQYCRKKGILEDVGTTIDLFLNKSLKDVCNEQYLSESAVKKRIKKFIESAN